MFTGIAEETGTIFRISFPGNTTHLTVQSKVCVQKLEIGASVACNGICLTVTEVQKNMFTAEIMKETCSKTTAVNWKSGTKLNLERAMSANGRFDGHIVQGHIDTIALVQAVTNTGQEYRIRIGIPSPSHTPLLAMHGSIAIDGISLTIARLYADAFEVALIPQTLQTTTLNLLKAGDKVNLEYDILGKYIQRQLNSSGKRLSEKELYEKGF
ncbi:MAG: riboflavin synthase [Candidatus Cloacimonetes bacterium]|nr:riboflavin synthase [Candidatus Cloacimonadota bacterium]